jgi:DNA-binding response OmpR family regulator
VSQSDINIGEYKLNLNSKEIIKNSKKLDLTEREANLIMYLNPSPSPVKIDQLQKEVWDYGVKLDTHTVDTHIYRLRKKISEKFSDEVFILNNKKGYYF